MYKRKIKILHIVHVSFALKYFIGNQFKYLNRNDEYQFYVACSASDELKEFAEKNCAIYFNLPVVRRIDIFEDIKSIVKLYRIIRRNKIDIIICHNPKGGLIGLTAAFLCKVKYRYFFRHGLVYETSSGIKRILLKLTEKYNGRLARKVVCVSESIKYISEKDNLNDSEKNVILGRGSCNGIDVEYYRNENIDAVELSMLRKELNITDGGFVVGYVGRLVNDKGINELVEAWQMVKSFRRDALLLLVGPFEKRDSLNKSTVDIINSDETIITTGFVRDSRIYYALMSIFILPSYREGLPTVVLEASSMGLPVLTTQNTGCKDSIIENVTGLFLEIDAVDICNKILYYMQNCDKITEHGSNGRAFVVENFAQERIWSEIEKQVLKDL